MTKTCFKCGTPKSLGEFYTHPQTADGYLGKCKDCHKKDTALNRSSKREQYRAYDRKRYAIGLKKRKTKEEMREIVKAWRRANPEKVAAHGSRRRAAKINAVGNYTGEEFIWLCIEYNHQCLDCGSYDKPLTVDHVIPLSKGGTNTIDNIQPLCGSCNSRKGVKTIDYRTKSAA